MAQEQGSGGPPGGKGKGPGAGKGTPKFGQGFEFGRGDRDGGRGGRDGRRGDRDGRGGRGRGRDEGGGGAGYRVVAELPALEKALSKTDFSAEKGPLESIVRALRQMRLSSLEQMDLGTRGKLITALLRVQRQPKPLPSEAPAAEAAPAEGAAAPAEGAEAPAAEAAAAEAPELAPVEGAAAANGSPAPAEGGEGAAAAAPAAPKPEDKAKSYSDVLYLVGRAWRAVGEGERASAAFELSGRTPEAEKEEPAAEARPPREGGRERGERGRDRKGPREGGRERGERGPRVERRPRAEPPLELTGDPQEQAKQLESAGRTRDAARIHERLKNYAEATRLFEAGGDLKSALRNALTQPDVAKARELISKLKPDEVKPVLEKSNAYELLMEHYVAAADFDNVARLYERARQFDQAALAWERAGKLTQARKAFERARDTGNAERVRQLEVDKLLQRGDKLGAAVILVAAGKKDRATEILTTLPGPKAYRFLQRVKLDTEARALADRELARADAENKPSARARWLELTGKTQEAAEAWEKADRKDKAYPLLEKLGNVQKAAEYAEASGHKTDALRLYEKLGDNAGVERAKAMPERQKPAPRDAEEEREEREHAEGAADAVAAPASEPEPVADGTNGQAQQGEG